MKTKEIYESSDKLLTKYVLIINEDDTSKITAYYPNGNVVEYTPSIAKCGKGSRVEYSADGWKVKSSIPFTDYASGVLDERFWIKIK